MVPIKFGQGGSGLEFLDLDDLHGSPQREEVAKARLMSLRQARSLAPSRLLCSIRSVATIAEPPTPFAFNRFPHCLTRGGSPHFAVLNVGEQSAQRIACYSINGISKQYESCIEACHECVTECEHCAVSCLHEQDIKMMVRFIALVRTAPICAVWPLNSCHAAQRMPRNSAHYALTFVRRAVMNAPNVKMSIVSHARKPVTSARKNAGTWQRHRTDPPLPAFPPAREQSTEMTKPIEKKDAALSDPVVSVAHRQHLLEAQEPSTTCCGVAADDRRTSKGRVERSCDPGLFVVVRARRLKKRTRNSTSILRRACPLRIRWAVVAVQ